MTRRQLNWQGFLFAVKDALRITCMVMVIITGAIIFGHFIAVAKIPLVLADWVGGLPLPTAAIMGLIVLMYLIGGCFMDALALIALTIPIIYPLVLTMGFDPIWFGVIIVLVTEMGVITPPVGVNVYVIKGIAEDVPLETIFKGIFPFLAALIVAVAILMAFHKIPYVATAVIGYPEDYARKLTKAMTVKDGLSYIHLLSPCPTGWRARTEDTIDICRLAVETNYFPLWEAENGKVFSLERGGFSRASTISK